MRGTWVKKFVPEGPDEGWDNVEFGAGVKSRPIGGKQEGYIL
jgi:hypothetical protein